MPLTWVEMLLLIFSFASLTYFGFKSKGRSKDRAAQKWQTFTLYCLRASA